MMRWKGLINLCRGDDSPNLTSHAVYIERAVTLHIYHIQVTNPIRSNFKYDTNFSWELFLSGHMCQLPERCSGCLHAVGKHVDLRVVQLTADYF